MQPLAEAQTAPCSAYVKNSCKSLPFPSLALTLDFDLDTDADTACWTAPAVNVNYMPCGRSLKPLHFKVGWVTPIDLLTLTNVMALSYNQPYGPEQRKGADQDL